MDYDYVQRDWAEKLARQKGREKPAEEDLLWVKEQMDSIFKKEGS